MSELVLIKKSSPFFEIILNRDAKRNALNIEMMEAIDVAFDEAERTPDMRVILLRGEGKGFSAGIDLMGFLDLAQEFGEQWRSNLFPFTAHYQGILNKVERCSLPVIAVLHGYVLGLGMELALACDFRIIAEGTKMGLPETLVGLIPDIGGSTRLTRLVGPARAKELIITGRNVNLQDAERWGLVNYVVPMDEVSAKARALAEDIIQAAPMAVSYAKRVINGITEIERGLQLEAWAQSVLIRSEDFATGAQAVLTKQPAQWSGK